MKTTHTAGPWSINGYAFQRDESAPTGRRVHLVDPDSTAAEGFLINAGHVTVCEVRRVRGIGDARLIAAAPELLDALKWAIDQIDDDLDADHQAAMNAARAAIAKAESRA